MLTAARPLLIPLFFISITLFPSRILFLDYDGTLVGFHRIPESAVPDEELYGILDKLSADSKSKVVLIS
ncbi:unnamed protein product, partial [marine sediment metagenome]